MAKKKSKMSFEQAQTRLREVRREIDRIIRAANYEVTVYDSKEVRGLNREDVRLTKTMAALDPTPKFKAPRSIKKFWLAPHCGPGTLDLDDTCGFCGRTRRECARANSDFLRDIPDAEGEEDCGGSGFWCSGCGRFWAQDSCGESPMGMMRSADGARQEIRHVDPTDPESDRTIHCVCGKQLARVRREE